MEIKVSKEPIEDTIKNRSTRNIYRIKLLNNLIVMVGTIILIIAFIYLSYSEGSFF